MKSVKVQKEACILVIYSSKGGRLRRFIQFPNVGQSWYAAVLLFMVCCAAMAQCAGPDCRRPFTLALHDHGLLYSAATDSGIDKDITDELIRRSGCNIIVSLMSRERIWQLIESGALDFSLSGIATPQRLRFASFAWYFSDKYYLLVRKDSGMQQLSEFKNNVHFQLGVIRSFRYSESANQLVDALAAANRVTPANGLDPLYQALLVNRIQGMIMEPFDYPVMNEKHLRELTEIVEFNDPPVAHGVIMSNKTLSPDEREKWRKLVEDMRADGTVLRIFEKYFPAAMAATMIDFQVPP